MRLVLVDNLLLENGRAENLYLQPHLGLISLVAVARGAGHSASVYDPKLDLTRGLLRLGPSLYRDIADRLLDQDPDVVGMTSLGCNFICTLKIAGYLKDRRPRLPILLGGPHATILDREILNEIPQFDVVVRNEAELTLLPVLDAISGGNLAGIPGVTYRTAGGVTANPGEPLIGDLDSLPFPAFDAYPLDSVRLPYLSMEAGRGCPFKCSFCSTATFFGRRYRLKSPQRIGAEMDYLHERYGFTNFNLTHDLFTVDRRKVLAFCQHIQGRGYTWGCSARMDCVDENLLAQMAASGCRDVYYGVETGSARMQKIVDKHLNLELVEPRLAATSRLGMTSTASFITGFPEEEQADQDQTLDLMGRCFAKGEEITVQLHLLTPEPGTGLTQRLGASVAYDGHISDFNFPTLESDDASVMQGHPGIFMNHHFYPTILPRRRHVFVTSVWVTLQGFGNTLLAHLTELSGSRFSQLVHDMDRWAVETGWSKPYGEAFICAYIEHRWPGHYLASAFRFFHSGRALSERALRMPGAPGAAADPTGQPAPNCLVMQPRSEVLREIHNVPAIMEKLRKREPGKDPKVPSSLTRRRLDLLIFVLEGSKEIRSLELEPGSSELARFLSTPRSMSQLRAFARSLGITEEDAVACVRQLQKAGVVVGAGPRREALARERPFARNRTSEAREEPMAASAGPS
jgi:radical SAM superfamily enzyme YgiQ (UPF0313 family)